MVWRMRAILAVIPFVLVLLPTPRPASGQTPLPLVSVDDFVVDSVTVEDGQLVANAIVTLDVVGRTVTREVQIPLELDGSPGEEGQCDILNLSLGPVDLNLLGLVVELDDCEGGPVTIDIVAQEGGGLLGDLLCGVAGLLDSGLDLGLLLEGLTDDEIDMLTGAIREVLDGVLGNLLSADPAALAHSHAGQQQRCDILTLEIPDGIHIDLLGLMVDTSGICLDVYAERGSGNLLGNLLCSITNLLNNRGNNAGGQRALIRNIERLLDRL
jgi:hypothetical protein